MNMKLHGESENFIFELAKKEFLCEHADISREIIRQEYQARARKVLSKNHYFIHELYFYLGFVSHHLKGTFVSSP